MMNLELIYLFSIRQHPAITPILKTDCHYTEGSGRLSVSVKGNVFDDDCAP